MQNSKMSETIKNILEVTDNVLGRPATRGQVIQVLELIESFDTPEPATATATTQVKTAKAKAPVTKKVKPKAKSKKSGRRYNSWRYMAPWFDSVLDGHSHRVTYNELAFEIRDYGAYNRETIRSRFTTEAKKRGYRYASMNFNDLTGTVLVRAIK